MNDPTDFAEFRVCEPNGHAEANRDDLFASVRGQ